MGMIEFKERLLDTGLFRKVSGSGQYVCKECPFCEDKKNHMYVLIQMDDDTPVLYHCFKCNSSGVINQKFLEYFEIEGLSIPRSKRRKRIDDINDIKIDISEGLFDIERDQIMIQKCMNYIEERVGVRPSIDDLRCFQILNPVVYAKEYLGSDGKGFGDRCWFCCTNGSIIGRSFQDTGHRWKKYSGDLIVNQRALYTMKKGFYLYDRINVCIAEGIFDLIGLYYHYPIENSVYISCLGKDYITGVKHMIDRGIFGDSVSIKIFKDSDVDDVKLDPKICSFFHDVNVYHNTLSKDYGVTADNISIEKCFQINHF